MKRVSVTACVAVTAAILTGAPACKGPRPDRPRPTESNFIGTAPATQQNQGSAPAVPQLGAFCSMDDLYKERDDAAGRGLRCGPDVNGTLRWQLIKP